MSITPTLAIDPGKGAGAAVLLDTDGRTVLGAWAWKERQQDKRAIWRVQARRGPHADELDEDPRTLAELGRLIRWYAAHALTELAEDPLMASAAWHLVVEGLFVGNARSSMILAESAALVYGPLLEPAVNASELQAGGWRPMANSDDGTGWREVLIGPAGRRSRSWWDRRARLLLPQLVDQATLGELVDNQHVVDGTYLARWGWVEQRRRLREAKALNQRPERARSRG